MTLSRQQGKAIVHSVALAMNELDRSWLDLKGKCSDDDFAEYGRKVSIALDSLTCEVLVPLFQEHPGLEPLAAEEFASLRQDQ